jgi:hypothetical protein
LDEFAGDIMIWDGKDKTHSNTSQPGEVTFNGGELLTSQNAGDVSYMRNGSDNGVPPMLVPRDSAPAFQAKAVSEAVFNLDNPDATVAENAQRTLQNSFYFHPEQTQGVITEAANNYANDFQAHLANDDVPGATDALKHHTTLIQNYQKYLQGRVNALDAVGAT